MKLPVCDYARPATLAETIALLAELGDGARLLAGGQSLLPMLALRLACFDTLLDLSGLGELQSVTKDESLLAIGAMVRQRDVERHPLVRQYAPLLSRATKLIGHPPIRNRGTIGGSLAHADPAAEYPAVAVVLDAAITIAGPRGMRTIAATEFFTGLWTTALERGEIIVDVRLPLARAGTGFAVQEVARRPGDFAMAGAAVAIEVDDGAVRNLKVACFGVADRPVLVESDAVEGNAVADVDPAGIGALAAEQVTAHGEGHALPDWYRARLVTKVTSAAVQEALTEAMAGQSSVTGS